MKYYIISGERSGDLHGSNLIKAITAQDPQAQIRAWGGDEMEKAGATVVKHYRELAIMGFIEVLKSLRKLKRFMKECQADLLNHKPDALILIDYGGFNLRMAKFAHTHGIPVHYYISPKLWAWNTGRAKKVKQYVDHMYVILPFEETFYQQFQYPVHFVGNPLFDAIKAHQPDPALRESLQQGKPKIAVLPGSRKQEVAYMLNIMLQVKSSFPDHEFVVAGVDKPAPSYV